MVSAVAVAVMVLTEAGCEVRTQLGHPFTNLAMSSFGTHE